MTEITFCRPVHDYESYYDFWRLVELSGFPIISAGDLDISKDGIYITAPMNEDWREHINSQHARKKPVNAHLILWNIERPSGSAGTVGNYAEQCRYLIYGLWPNGEKTKKRGDGEIVESYGRFIDEVWVSDARLADETETRFVVLGSDEGLGSPGDEKHYGFCHMSYETNRRKGRYIRFNSDIIGPNGWGDERDRTLKASKFGVALHQDRHPFQEPLRMTLFAAYGLPIVMESCVNPYPWGGEHCVIVTLDDFVGKMRALLDEPYEPYREMGLRARERMTGEFRFKAMVEQAVKESVGQWR